MTFQDVEKAFTTAKRPDSLPPAWQSPHRMLGGAAFSIGWADSAMKGNLAHRAAPALPADWWDAVKTRIGSLPVQVGDDWVALWFASYMLTNAVFRVASAVEKMFVLKGLTAGRSEIFKAAREPQSPFFMPYPKAHLVLSKMPPRKPANERPDFLNNARSSHTPGAILTAPLVCAFIQTDTDKHVPYAPLKRLEFDLDLSIQSFLQACEVWDEVQAH